MVPERFATQRHCIHTRMLSAEYCGWAQTLTCLDLFGFHRHMHDRLGLHAEVRCSPVEQFDGPAVAALKAAGAVLVGITNMPELGMSPVGLNQHYGSARNPWNFAHLCGGSSSGGVHPVYSLPKTSIRWECCIGALWVCSKTHR